MTYRDRPSRSYLEDIVARQDLRAARALQDDALVGSDTICMARDGTCLIWDAAARMHKQHRIALAEGL